MNFLAIDASGKHLTVIASGKKLSKRYIKDCALSHSVVLMDEVEKALFEAEISLKDVEVFACAVGAGSFTGIRIGIATVKAFAYAVGAKVLPVTSFETLAYNVISKKRKLALISARHSNYYACGFTADNLVERAPSFMTEGEIEELLKTEDYEVVSDEETPFCKGKADLKEGFYKAVSAKLPCATADIEQLVPLYVKKSQAEEEL